MAPLILENQTSKGEKLQATFLPEKGMNLISLKKDELEIIDQSTWPLFEERYAGLGALIGPHFHRRPPALVPQLENESLFPHIARVRLTGPQDPFSHGIARYAPWQVKSTATTICAQLQGDDKWKGVSLKAIEGQDFSMTLNIELKANGLFLNYSVNSEKPSLVGLHYYYRLSPGKNRVLSKVQDQMMSDNQLSPLPSAWYTHADQELTFDLQQVADYTFYPSDSLKGEIWLATEEYVLKTSYLSSSVENSWQLYHPKEASFACIEPLSAKNPRQPQLTSSSLNIHLEILSNSN